MLKMLKTFFIPIKNVKGKTFTIICVFPLIILLGFADFVLCDNLSKDSASLGFQIQGFCSNDDKANNLMSENGVFSFGFLEKDGEFVVGIRYNLGPKLANVPVWTVGGGVRVSSNSTFILSMDGRLILFENFKNSIIWSTNTSNLDVKKLTLLNNGNLVLMGSESKVIWQSFDRPTNTLLPGQTLSYPRNLRAPSTKSVTSYYTFVIDREGVALMWESNVTYWKSHLSSFSSSVKDVRFNPNGVLEMYDDREKIVWSVSSKDFGESSVSLRHLRMDQDGNLRIYSWDTVVRTWRIGWQAVEDQCNVFGSCGLYSVCGYNSTGPDCGCLYSGSLDRSNEFPLSDSGNGNCKKMVDLGNCKAHTSMLVLKQTVLYGLFPPHDVDMMLNEEDCKEFCSNDTTCYALTSKNDGSGLCTLKRTGFISGSTSPSIPSTSFLKVCLVPQAVAAKGANVNPNSIPKVVSIPFRGNYRKIISAIAFVVIVTVLVILVLEMFVVMFLYQKRRNDSIKRSLKGAKTNLQNSALIRLSYKEVHELTSGFSNQLGFFVFKGLLFEETVVVAKVLDATVLTEKEFIKAVSILGGTHHRNLVSLKGFCFEPKHKVLIYEWIPNGSVDKWLFDKNDRNWQKRVDIAVGVTRALAYLHTECQVCIPHGNLKLENVLLDENLRPKVTDYGIKSFLQSDGACSSNESPSERDVYMLGKLLTEIVLLSREAIGESLDQVMDQVMQEQKYLDSEDIRGVERVVRIALWCMQNQPFLRPSVGEVVKVLEGTLSVDRPPASFAYRNGDDIEITDAGGGEIEQVCKG